MDNTSLLERISEARHRHPGEKRLQIYLHIPFCASKCHFCDWVDDIPVAQLRSGPDKLRLYVDALCRQIRYWGPHLTALGYRPTCIYWGGGTPTRLEAESFPVIQEALASSFDLGRLSQHTLESTPNNLTPDRLAALERIGVTRVSLGVQSFDADQLRRAGRSHSADQAIEAIVRVKQSSIHDLNLDLISGFPDEKLSVFKRTLETAVALEPQHVSVYSYRATPRTIMAVQSNRGVRSRLEYDSMVESYELAQDVLTRGGYREYCFNYFVREDRFQFEAGLYGYRLDGDIVGFGAGAESTLGTMALTNGDTSLAEYLEDPVSFESATPFGLDRPEMLFPLFGGALMTEGGLVHRKLEYLTGIPFDEAWAHPDVRAWFQFVQNCGARLSFEADRVRAEDRSGIHRVYLKNLSYTLNPALAALA